METSEYIKKLSLTAQNGNPGEVPKELQCYSEAKRET
jgi:hypothetical protein